MTSKCNAAPAARSPLATLGRHHPMSRAGNSSVALLKLGPTLSHAPFVSRFNDAIRWQTKQRLSAAFAQGPSDWIANDDDRGPPIATILAGFLVFVLFGWVFRAIITWLSSLTV